MKQSSFSDLEYSHSHKRKRTRRETFLSEMEQVVPWQRLVSLIEPYYPKAGNGRRPYALEVMLRIHFMQQWFNLADEAMEETLYDITCMREFAGLSLSSGSIPDETTILNFRHLLEEHKLASRILGEINILLAGKGLLLHKGSIVDATIINAPSSTKNKQKQRDPEMHSTKKGNQYYFGMKAHIGVDVESGLVHTVTTTPANTPDVTQGHAVLHGKEKVVYADAGYRGVMKREEATGVKWEIAMNPGQRRQLDKTSPLDQLINQIEKLKAQIRAKVEHPFRVIKRQFGYIKTRYKGLAKNTSQIMTLFALSNLWMARKPLLQAKAQVRPMRAKVV